MRLWILTILSLALSACGDEPYIADKVKFRVHLSRQLVEVSFDLSPAYKISRSERIPFGSLGVLSSLWNEESQINQISALLNASPETLQSTWPLVTAYRLPGNRRLPESIPSGAIKSWKVAPNDLSFSFMFQDTPLLIAGGGVQNAAFNSLPKKFYATQVFRAANGDVQASISALGPADGNEGGLFFFGNFGENPFSARQASPKKSLHAFGDETVMEWELPAQEPLKIMNPGDLKILSLPWHLPRPF